MKEIRIHARAGQGAITTAQILGTAAFMRGMYAYAFPTFGAARMGAPMNAFVRVDDKPIRLRCQVYEPDYVMVVDPTLIWGFDVFAGIKLGGIAVVTHRDEVEVPKVEGVKVYEIPAEDIARETIGRPLGNTALLGAFVAATKLVDIDALCEAIMQRFGGAVGEKNVEAARRGYQYFMENYA